MIHKSRWGVRWCFCPGTLVIIEAIQSVIIIQNLFNIDLHKLQTNYFEKSESIPLFIVAFNCKIVSSFITTTTTTTGTTTSTTTGTITITRFHQWGR